MRPGRLARLAEGAPAFTFSGELSRQPQRCLHRSSDAAYCSTRAFCTMLASVAKHNWATKLRDVAPSRLSKGAPRDVCRANFLFDGPRVHSWRSKDQHRTLQPFLAFRHFRARLCWARRRDLTTPAATAGRVRSCPSQPGDRLRAHVQPRRGKARRQ